MIQRWMGNVNICVTNKDEVIQTISERWDMGKRTTVFFLNAHCYNVAQKDKSYREVINHAELLLNDGIGVELGAKVCGFSLNENLNGTDFTPHLLTLAARKNRSVYLLGGNEQVAAEAAKKLSQTIPNLNIVGWHDGYFDNDTKMVKEINKTNADLLIVAMGVPLQEKWIYRNRSELNATVITGVGAFLDFVSGRVKRAPKWMRVLKVEWVFRLLLEPKRLWKRYLVGNAVFFYNIFKARRMTRL